MYLSIIAIFSQNIPLGAQSSEDDGLIQQEGIDVGMCSLVVSVLLRCIIPKYIEAGSL
jgi:hypothetical protein